MRQFKLINGDGAEFSLMQKGRAFLYNPSGLGWGYETTIVDVGKTYIPLETKYTHPAPAGMILFGGYEDYDDFLRFIQVGGLKLAYMPLSSWQYLDCSIVIEKTEIDHETKRLHCDVTFSGLSRWYKSLVTYRAGAEETTYSAKRYTYQYNDNTPSGDDGYIYPSTSGRAEISNGVLPSYCKITIMGPAVNPAWALYDSSNHHVGRGKINYTIASGRKLVVNSRPSEMEIAEYTTANERVQSLYSYSDFSTERLLLIPPGDGLFMTFTDDGGTLEDCSVEVYEFV